MRHRTRTFAVPALLAVPMIWAAGATGCTGGGAEYGCPDIPACGGNPVGVWKVHEFCQYTPPLSYKVQTPPQPPQTIALTQSPNLAKLPPAARASGDWCTSLQYTPPDPTKPNVSDAGQIAQLYQLVNTPGGVVAASVTVSDNHQYEVAVQTTGTTVGHFAPTCLTQFGVNPSCDDLSLQLIAYETQPNYNNTFVCRKTTDGGCDCTYSYENTAADQGTWQTVGDSIYFYSAYSQFQPIVQATYCAKDNRLTVTGSNGQSLFATPGLRSLTLVPAPK